MKSSCSKVQGSQWLTNSNLSISTDLIKEALDRPFLHLMMKPPETKVEDASLLALTCKDTIGQEAALPAHSTPIQASKRGVYYARVQGEGSVKAWITDKTRGGRQT